MFVGRLIAVSLFALLQESFPPASCKKLENKSGKHFDVEELFRGRIEAPNKTHILDTIFKGYDKRIRPHYREKPVLVSLYAAVDSFHDIKEEEMEYKVELILKENWKDPRLAYGNASWFVRLKGDTLAKVWYPDTLIENSRKHVVDDKTRTAFLFGDGTMFLSEWIKATLTSHMEFHRYPMDAQTLRLQIAAYSYDDTQVRYEWSKLSLKERDMTEFYVHEQSLRLESSAFITGAHTAAVAEFQIRRRLQHYILGFYLPCITCTCCSWIQFWMAADEIGDRAGLGIATVLTEIFLLEFSSHGMPKVSYVKAAELYVVVSFAFIFSALVESAVVYKASAIILKGNTEDGKKDNDQEYQVEVMLKENWDDPRLAYGNASWFVRLKGDTLAEVWYPDSFIENARKHDVDDKTRTAYLFGDGTIFLSEWIKATLTSHMDFHRYPMDVQTLILQISGYSYDDTQVKYGWSSVSLKEKDMTEFYVDKENLFLKPTSFITGTHTAAVAEFRIRRRLQHYIFGFYLPCLTCTCASWIQFWMDGKDIAGRASVGTATVLAEIFLLQYSNQEMPKVSYLNAAELFVVASFAFISLALVESAVVYKVSSVTLKRNVADCRKKTHKQHSSSSRGKIQNNKLFPSAEATSKSGISNSVEADAALSQHVHVECTNHCLPEEEVATPFPRNLGSVIDQGARFTFPLIYITFTAVYFSLGLA